MSAEGYFAPQDPNDYSAAPRLPEAYLPQTIEGMLPGDIIHLEPKPNCIGANTLGEVFLNRDFMYDPQEATQPDYDSSNYVAVMRVCQREKNGKLVDGYIVDIRLVAPGEIMIALDDDEASEDGDEMDDMFFGRRVPVLGIISKDEDDMPCYASTHLEETLDEAVYLGQTVDSLCFPIDVKAKLPKPPKSKKKSTAKQKPEAAPGTDELPNDSREIEG